jgi:hypothetical protein
MKNIKLHSLLILIALSFYQCGEDKYKNHRTVVIKDLGFSFKIPPKCYVDSNSGPGGIYVSIRSGIDYFGAIQRNSNYFTKEVFLQETRTFEYSENEIKISINKDTSLVKVIRSKQGGNSFFKEYYFKFIKTKFYNFMIWAKDPILLQTFIETFNTDDKKLASDYANHIDYEIIGKDTINFLNGALTLKRGSDNFLSINYHDDKMIGLFPRISSGANCTTFIRGSNFFNIRVNNKAQNFVVIDAVAKYKDFKFIRICSRKYRIID